MHRTGATRIVSRTTTTPPDATTSSFAAAPPVSIPTSAEKANAQTDGFSGQVQRSFKRWDEAVRFWQHFCREHHRGLCPPVRPPTGFVAPTPMDQPPPAPPSPAPLSPAPHADASPPHTPTPCPFVCARPHKHYHHPKNPPTCAFGCAKLHEHVPPDRPQSRSLAEALASPFETLASPARPRVPPSIPYNLSFPNPANAPTSPPPSSSPRRAASSTFSLGSLTDVSGSLTDESSSPPRTLTQVVEIESDDEYGMLDADFEIEYVDQIFWAVKHVRHAIFNDAPAALQAALSRRLSVFTLMSATDELTLEQMHDLPTPRNAQLPAAALAAATTPQRQPLRDDWSHSSRSARSGGVDSSPTPGRASRRGAL
ncbi:hypothetical protein R3P38DRAFT_3222007 [Favolaschia claudopus]|uniref:Uncharacterized protein n=1 Tax=Favolaschia claudopus TaxID=2862362 RepID=A0AAV9ZZ60_9AGAR